MEVFFASIIDPKRIQHGRRMRVPHYQAPITCTPVRLSVEHTEKAEGTQMKETLYLNGVTAAGRGGLPHPNVRRMVLKAF